MFVQRSNHRLLLLAVSFASLGGCRQPNYGSTARQLGRTEVVFVGALHARHLRSEEFPLGRISEFLERVQPTVVFVQAPPDLIDGLLTLPEGHPWLAVLPEVGEAIRFAKAHRLSVAGISAWVPGDAARWRDYSVRFPEGPDDPAYRRARDYLITRSAREGRTELEWLSSPLFERLCAWTDQNRDRALAGDPARPDWSGHRSLFRDALARYPGQRIAVVFDARRVWMLAEEVERSAAVRIDPRAFLE